MESYTTNPHERSASGGRAATERLPSEFARWPLGMRSVVARQTTCSAIARQALVGISGVLHELPMEFYFMNKIFSMFEIVIVICREVRANCCEVIPLYTVGTPKFGEERVSQLKKYRHAIHWSFIDSPPVRLF